MPCPLGPSKWSFCELCLSAKWNSLFRLGPWLGYLPIWEKPYPVSNDEKDHSGGQRRFCRWFRSFEKSGGALQKEVLFLGHSQDSTSPNSSLPLNGEGGEGDDINKEADRLPSRPYRFLFIGRIEKVKGIDLLLQSMASIVEEGLDVQLTIVGKGGMEEWGRNFVKEKGLGERVEWMGNVSDEKLAWLYGLSDCVVIPSRSESIPLVFSEALAFNKELIVTDVGDMGMLGRQYGVAWVVPAEDPTALKEMMKERVEPERYGNGVGNGRKREELERLFNIETVWRGFWQITPATRGGRNEGDHTGWRKGKKACSLYCHFP